MRRKDRAVTEFQQQLEILARCRIIRLAMQDAQGLYIVPLSLGYVVEDQKLRFYVHSAAEGRKAACMTPGCPVAFELEAEYQVTPHEVACKFGCTYASLMGTGHASLVTDPAEKALGLSAVMRCQSGKEFTFTPEQLKPVAIFRIDVEELTGKQNLL